MPATLSMCHVGTPGMYIFVLHSYSDSTNCYNLHYIASAHRLMHNCTHTCLKPSCSSKHWNRICSGVYIATATQYFSGMIFNTNWPKHLYSKYSAFDREIATLHKGTVHAVTFLGNCQLHTTQKYKLYLYTVSTVKTTCSTL